MGGLSYGQTAIFEWLERVLPVGGPPEHPKEFRFPDEAVAAVLRHHPHLKATDLAALGSQASQHPSLEG